MRNLKNIYYANWVIFGTSLLLYLTLFFGAFLHILFGAFQVVIAFFLLYHFRKLTKIIQQQLVLYFILTVTTCVITYILQGDLIIYSWISTWILALFFTGILFQTKNLNYEN